MPEQKRPLQNGVLHSELIANGYANHKEHKSRPKLKNIQQHNNVDISQEVARAVQSLKTDIERLANKVNILENTAKTSKMIAKWKHSIFGVSPPFLAFIVAWPFIATVVINRFFYKRK